MAGIGTCCCDLTALHCPTLLHKMNAAFFQVVSYYWQVASLQSLTVLRMRTQWPKVLNAPLAEVDPELEDIIEHEKNRQWKVKSPF